MREVYPLQLLAVDLSEIVEVHTSSGTTGNPVVDAYTGKDIGIWAESMARTLAMGDTSRADVVHNAYGYGLFTGGLGVHYGARLIGATVIPISGGNTARQLSILRDFRGHGAHLHPLLLPAPGRGGAGAGAGLPELSLRVGLFGAEPWSEGMRREIEAKLRLKALDIYGLTEVIGPGVASECEVQDGLHICEDLFYPEVIDPATGQVLPDGAKGELVLTTLTKEGTPMLRYRTRDITYPRALPLPLRADLGAHAPPAGAHRRHAHHPRGERVPVADRGGAPAASTGWSRTTSWSWSGRRAWTAWRSRWR